MYINRNTTMGYDYNSSRHNAMIISLNFLQTSYIYLVPLSNVNAAVNPPNKEGTSAGFTCTASGTSPITYTLHKVGGVTSGDRWSNASGVFTLSNIQRADAGEYRCTADNEAKRPQTSDAVTLEVYCKYCYMLL